MSAKRVLIVGGVAGGASCAARLRRLDEQAEIVVFEKGPYPSFANCGLPYYIGDIISDETKLLVATPILAADDDPSGIATYSQTGAEFGYGQLWIALFTLPLMTAMQEACARIGLVTGKGIVAVVKEHYGAKMTFAVVLLVLIANTINIGADIGAMAAAAEARRSH